jgi:seryl-tRNA synthetase
MHDARDLLAMGPEAVRKAARRGYDLDLTALEQLVSERNATIRSGDELRAESKRVAQAVQDAARSGGDVQTLKQRARDLKDRIRESDAMQEQLDRTLRELLLEIPNLPDDDVPDGDSEDFAVEIRRHGEPPAFAFPVRDHVELGETMGILDFGRAAKLSGTRFSVSRGPGAALERALVTLFLDLHTTRHGYSEYSVPYLVTSETMTGTGQLPKFEQDLFKTSTGERELFLIPTAEVPLTNLHAREILNASQFPLAYTAQTPCFRSEAGSYGRDTRGLLRLHQFTKVELVRIVAPDDSRKELETMLGHAEACLRELELAYRVIALPAGDLGFAAKFTYDVEVWLPSQGRYREVSSCSDCGTFQARRAGIRFKDDAGRRGFAATLNGSGLPVGRTMAAILEQFQQPDGSVAMPPALVPYLGFHAISSDGKPVS